MAPQVIGAETSQIRALLRGEPDSLAQWIAKWSAGRMLICLGLIFAGAGLFGGAMGLWRAPLQAVYGAVKLPLIVLLTTLGNALLNGMLAPLLGLNLRFRESLLAILMSFTIAAIILGSFSPVLFFLVWNTPPTDAAMGGDAAAYSLVRLVPVAVIAFAGVAANLRLMQLLRQLGGSRAIARRILFAWLAGNLLLGSQLGWILRPFIGAPYLPVEFLRPNAFEGNFYETVFRALGHLLTS